MLGTSNTMEYYAGFDKQLVEHSKEMIGAASCINSWIKNIEKEYNETISSAIDKDKK
jgi:hypothetical protein